MGLNTSFGAWDGPYSSFNQWREWLAKQINLELNMMEGYGGDIAFDRKHDLTPLLNHSDCEGYLSVRDCKRIKRGLEAILLNHPGHEKLNKHFDLNGWQLDKVRLFIKGCEIAIQSKKDIEFH